MRENTKWIMLVTALAFVALMVFEWGMDLTGQSSAQVTGGDVGSVNGDDISYQEYMTAYQNLYQSQQQALGGGVISQAMNRQIEDAAWDQIVMQRLISQELRRRGITVSDEEVRQAARQMPPQEFMSNEMFQTNGQFDLAKYHQFLSSPALDITLLQQLEAYYRDVIPRSKLYFQTAAGTFVNDAELWRIYRDQTETATVRFIAFDPTQMIPDAAVSVTEEELRAYFQAHQDDFIRPARARVKYVAMSTALTAADSAAVRERADSIRARIVAGGDFAQIAQEESADSISAANGGLLDITRGQTVGPFDTAAFTLPVGQVSQPVRTMYGYHIVKVESRQADSASVRHVLIPFSLTPENEDRLLDRADSLDILAETLKLDEIGRQLGLPVAEADLVPGLTIIPQVGIAEDGEYWAFQEGRVGEVSPVFESPTAYYVFELLDREDQRTLTFDEARETVTAAVRTQKKIDRAMQTAREAAERIQSGQSLDQVAAANDLTVQEAGPFTRLDFVPGLGRLNAAIGTAFGLRTGQTSGVVQADNKLFIVQLVERHDADRAEWEAQKDVQRQQITATLVDQRWNQFLQALREEAEIVDNRQAVLNPPDVAEASTR